MITFSDDPQRAEQEMHAVIFYLVTFGYIDGDFDAAEKSFVRQIIRKLIEHRAETAMPDAAPEVKSEIIEKFTKHFHEVFEGIDANVRELFTESVSSNEDPKAFVHSKLKVRCFEIFQSFDTNGQTQLMDLIDSLLLADGVAHPAEVQFRSELAQLLEADLEMELTPADDPSESQTRISVGKPVNAGQSQADHPFFKPFEFHFSSNPDALGRQVGADRALLDQALATLEEQRRKGSGRLTGKKSLADVAPGEAFLDGHTYVRKPKPGHRTELTVLGDLHGCYSILKATVLQSRFFERVDAYRKNPGVEPYPLLVLLGDYIDRGRFSLNGVLRTVLQLFVTAPDHVIMLRGNHEYYVEVNGTMYGGVKPAEAINSLKPHLPVDVFRHYRTLFEAMPNVFLFDRFMFVHGGIPKDRAIKEKWKDLSSLNDGDLRFQMMWSDPSTADVIPADLQDQAARFAFGRMQFRAFMQRVGANTMMRGHEKIIDGFHAVYDDELGRLLTLFSAGGKDNNDLPAESAYRDVTPMACTITHDGQTANVVPWSPDWRSYNDPERNAFFKVAPEIEHGRA
ncbi:MAG: serine/threonine protein phosphatase [Labilithrix sp.]|nr:serine/threonine protein phosphatase [Labilithrix sp.]MCW5810644.1 serine/threonine protein phosphatase [Labilithrix sp.]